MFRRHPLLPYRLFAMLAYPLVCAFAQDVQCTVERQVDITVQSSPDPSLPGQSVKFSVFVSPVINTVDPTGTVQLMEDLVDLGTFPLKLGQVTFSRTFNSAGAHNIQVFYGGDFTYCAAAARFGQQVDRLTPAITLTTSASGADFAAPVTLTAQVTATAPSGVAGPAGPVQFFEGTTLVGTGTLVSGKAAATVSNLVPGPHQISATLVGDANWYSVRSAPVTVTINRAATTTVLTAASTATRLNLNVAVSSGGAQVSSGSVQLVDATTNATLGTATLPGASFSLALSQVAGEPLMAIYSGSAGFAPSTSSPIGIPGIINATGATLDNFAPDEIVSLFGFNLGKSASDLTGTPPLPLDLGGTSVTVTDSAGAARQAGLYLAGVRQINFVIPSGTAPGPATITVGGSAAVPNRVNIAAVAPGIFTSAVQIIRVRADGSQTLETATSSTPIAMGSDTLYLVLFGTGIRNRSSLAGVTLSIGSLGVPAAFAGAQPQFPGLDQVNALLPASLKGAGQVTLQLTVDGQASNSMTLTFQ